MTRMRALQFLLHTPARAACAMAMIPSLFAILVAFLMRLTGISLNIATLPSGSTATALRHALLVAGLPIAMARLINASGFLARTFSDLPLMRQFGVPSSASILALLADFTALLGALWILSHHQHEARA